MRGWLSYRRIGIQEHHLNSYSGLLSQRPGTLREIILKNSECVYDNPGNLNEIDFQHVVVYTAEFKLVFFHGNQLLFLEKVHGIARNA